MRSTLCAVFAGICVVSVLPASVAAQSQSSDTLPFRRGQWGVELPVYSSYAITLLRITSNRSAWLIDGGVQLANDKGRGEQSRRTTQTIQNYNVRVGRRLYRPFAFRTAGFFDVGVLQSVSSWGNTQSDPLPYVSSTRDEQYGTGVFVQAGGRYFVTPRLSVGMSTWADVAYRVGRSRYATTAPGYTSISKARTRGYSFNAHAAVLTGSLYF